MSRKTDLILKEHLNVISFGTLRNKLNPETVDIQRLRGWLLLFPLGIN